MKKQKIKFEKSRTGEIPENKKQEFFDKLKNFEYLRQNRVSRYQGIYIALLVASAILFIDFIAGNDMVFKIIVLVILIILAEGVYKKYLIQTQKPVFVCENAVGTVEKGSHYVKAKNGEEYAIFSISDFIVKDDKTKFKETEME